MSAEEKATARKAVARKVALAARASAHAAGFDAGANEAANARLLKYLRDAPRGSTIAGYCPIRTEISPMPTLERLGALGYRLCLPVVLGKDRPLEFRAWAVGEPLQVGAFGAEIPAEGEAVIPDIVITPLVGFDRRGHRLGYGGGFYDRSLAEIGARGRVVAVGFAYSAQELEHIAAEPTDVALDAIITERDALAFPPALR